MNQKQAQPSIILVLIGVAMLIRASSSQNIAMFAVGFFLFFVAGLRFLLLHKYTKIQVNEVDSEDMIAKYCMRKYPLLMAMYDAYKYRGAVVEYGEIDGILLYDKQLDRYLASATTLAGARDVLYKIVSDYDELHVYNRILQDEMLEEMKIQACIPMYNMAYKKKDCVLNDAITFAPYNMNEHKIPFDFHPLRKKPYDTVDVCLFQGQVVGLIMVEVDRCVTWEIGKSMNLQEDILTAWFNQCEEVETYYCRIACSDTQQIEELERIHFMKSDVWYLYKKAHAMN